MLTNNVIRAALSGHPCLSWLWLSLRKRGSWGLLVAWLLAACTPSRLPDTAHDGAQLLSVEEISPSSTLCTIRDPWHQGAVLQRYLLVPRDDAQWDASIADSIRQACGDCTLLRTPLQHMAVTTSCHAWLLSELGALDCVTAMCDTAYIRAHSVQTWMRSTYPDGRPHIADAGTATAPNAEVLLSATCDAVWVSPYENQHAATLSQLQLPVIWCADYMEQTPLGRAEWMRFYGRLVGRAHQADSLFAAVTARYDSLVATHPSGPRLMAELPYGATWYVPGGASTAAQLYRDAGYRYAWRDDTHAGSLALSREAVLAQAQDCDVWLIRYSNAQHDMTLADLLSQDALFKQFRATQTGQVWGCNTAVSDIFDVTPFRPDVLLSSLIAQDGRFYKLLK